MKAFDAQRKFLADPRAAATFFRTMQGPDKAVVDEKKSPAVDRRPGPGRVPGPRTGDEGTPIARSAGPPVPEGRPADGEGRRGGAARQADRGTGPGPDAGRHTTVAGGPGAGVGRDAGSGGSSQGMGRGPAGNNADDGRGGGDQAAVGAMTSAGGAAVARPWDRGRPARRGDECFPKVPGGCRVARRAGRPRSQGKSGIGPLTGLRSPVSLLPFDRPDRLLHVLPVRVLLGQFAEGR